MVPTSKPLPTSQSIVLNHAYMISFLLNCVNQEL